MLNVIPYTNDNLNSLYLGESVDDLELILRVENSPAISQLAFSVDFNSDFFSSSSLFHFSFQAQ